MEPTSTLQVFLVYFVMPVVAVAGSLILGVYEGRKIEREEMAKKEEDKQLEEFRKWKTSKSQA